MRVSKLLIGLVAVAAVMSSPVLACKGNKVLYEDNFDDPTDESWGKTDDQLMLGNGKLTLKPKEGWVMWPYFTGSLFDDMDVCVIANNVSQRGETFGGLQFWRDTRSSDFYILGWFASGEFRIDRHQKDKWLTVKSIPKADIKQGPNGLRLTIKGNSGTAYLNDKQVFTFKGVNVADGGAVGFYAQSGDWEFSKLKITNVPAGN